MAARTWYGAVPDEALLAFERELEQGEWGVIDISRHDSEQRQLDEPLDLQADSLWKLRLHWALQGLAQTIGRSSASELEEIDDAWDAPQKQLHAMLSFHEASRDPGKSEAARRLRPLLLRGSGLAQTKLSYEQEADFGLLQLRLTGPDGDPQILADVALLGLEPILADVRAATEKLTAALGRAPGGERLESPSRRLKAARTECRDAFATVHFELDALLSLARPGHGRDRVERLLAPMQKLLERHRPESARPPATRPSPPSTPASP